MSHFPSRWTLLPLAVLALLAGGCKPQDKKDTKGQPIAVQVTTVAPGSIARTLVYDATNASTYIPLMKAGAHTLTLGVEGNGTGQPKHVQAVLFTGLPLTVTVGKDLVLYESSWEGAAAPTTDMFAGGVWA